MALEDAIREMGAYAARGRIGAGRPVQPRLQLIVSQQVTRGDVAQVSWQVLHAREVWLLIASPGRRPQRCRIGARGQRSLHDLPIGRTVVRLLATPRHGHPNMGQFEREAGIDVVHPVPLIEANFPRRVEFGNALHIWWQVRHADHAELVSQAGIQQLDFEGDMDLRPADCGRHRYAIRAVGPGGRLERTFTVEIVAPPVSLSIPGQIVAEQGEDVAIRYRAVGAVRLSVKPLDRDEPARLIPMEGLIHIDGAMESERFVLTATGHDGRTHSRSATLSVGPVAPPSINDFLEILNRRL